MKISPEKLPVHIAVIMDGNGRWAKKRLLPRPVGHKFGFDRFVDIVGYCSDLGIGYLTVYAFSTENASRPDEEVASLFSLAAKALSENEGKLRAHNIRPVVIGDISIGGSALEAGIRACEERLSANTGMTLCIAFGYGGRSELLRAVNQAVQNGKPIESEAELSALLYTGAARIPDPDLIIRSGGEKRLSNFLLYQSAYSELYFTDTLWPDFDRSELDKALADYADRARRYGGTESR